MTIATIREIKAIRTRLGFTQGYVADQLGINVAAYRSKENGRVRFSDTELTALAKVLQLSLAQLNDFFFDGKLPPGQIDAADL